MLPNFLILGAPKCGTTTLYEMLRSRGDIFMSTEKDPLFFELDDEYKCGPDYYRQEYFSQWNGQPIVGEARAAKLMLPFVPLRIHRTLPDARLVVMIRNPVDRLMSHWWMRTCNGKERRPLHEVIERNLEAVARGCRFGGPGGPYEWRRHIEGDPALGPVYLEFGYYEEQIQRYLRYFPRSRIKILFLEDLQQRPGELIRGLLEFVGAKTGPPYPRQPVYNAALRPALRPLLRLDHRVGISKLVPGQWKERIKSAVARRGARPDISAALRRRIIEHYLPHNEALSRLTGRDLSHWGVNR